MKTSDLENVSLRFTKSTLGAGALLIHRQRVLLVQINYGPFKDGWILPGGMVEQGEHPFAAAVRETKEETGLDITIDSLLAVRHRLLEEDGATANVYFVFLAKLTDENSHRDSFPKLAWPDAELKDARFWPLQEALAYDLVRPMTKMFIQMGLEHKATQGHKRLPLPHGAKFDDSLFGVEL